MLYDMSFVLKDKDNIVKETVHKDVNFDLSLINSPRFSNLSHDDFREHFKSFLNFCSDVDESKKEYTLDISIRVHPTITTTTKKKEK